jgi:hypothetical protein
MESGAITNINSMENFTDVDGTQLDHISMGDSYSLPTGQRNITKLDNFLDRPVEILKFQFVAGTPVATKINPWNTYFNHQSVRAKIRNFAFIRLKLMLKIIFSGTQWHYGRVLLSPQPLDLANETLAYWEAAVAADATFMPLFLNYLSQAPGSYIVNVNENMPVEIEMPYISPKPMHRLFNNTTPAVGSTTPFDDLDFAGSLYIYSINTVKAVSASPSLVYVQMYAWCEEVELGCNTGTVIDITAESKVDERKVGPIEKVASSLSTVAGALSSITPIAPFALASQMLFSGVASAAAILGWSKPVLNTNPEVVRNYALINGAVTIGTDVNKRIVLDPMQELTVDPAVCGTTSDDMSIMAIASRPSYLTTFAVNDNSAANVPLWTCAVSPNLVTYQEDPAHDIYCQPTALAMSAQPFEYWRGTIKFRLEIVCSSFHRFKMGIGFEPNSLQSALINTSIELNKQYLAVIDIQETQVVEFEIPWASPYPWLQVGDCQTVILNHGTFVDIPSTYKWANGYIFVFPFTELQSPDNSDISVNVYVNSDNIHYNGFTTINLPASRKIFEPEPPEPLTIRSESSCKCSVEVTTLDLNKSTSSDSGISLYHFGEEPISFRTLMKRYVYQDQAEMKGDTTAVPKHIEIIHQILPINQLPYGTEDVSELNLFSYFRYAYLGIKGSLRYRLYAISSVWSGNHPMKVKMANPTDSFDDSRGYVQGIAYNDNNGGVSFIGNIDGTVQYECPYYSQNSFSVCFSDNYALGESEYFMSKTWYRNVIVTLPVLVATSIVTPVYKEIASGEDFSLMRFQGAVPYTFAAVG